MKNFIFKKLKQTSAVTSANFSRSRSWTIWPKLAEAEASVDSYSLPLYDFDIFYHFEIFHCLITHNANVIARD